MSVRKSEHIKVFCGFPTSVEKDMNIWLGNARPEVVDIRISDSGSCFTVLVYYRD